MTSTLKAIKRAMAKNRVNPQRARPSYSAKSQNMAYLRCEAKRSFGIMGVGPKESNSRGDALIENGNMPNGQLRETRQSESRPDGLRIREVRRPLWRMSSPNLLQYSESSRSSTHQAVGKERVRVPNTIVTPPEVATYQKYTKPLPSASSRLGSKSPLSKLGALCYTSNMKQLYKEGKRRCYVCKEILPISSFREATKTRYECRPCAATYSRMSLIKRLGGQCAICKMAGEPGFFDIDHIVPLLRKQNGLGRAARYIKSEINNLQLLCPNCHRYKTMIEVKNGSYQASRGFGVPFASLINL